MPAKDWADVEAERVVIAYATTAAHRTRVAFALRAAYARGMQAERERAKRCPPPPETLVDALHDRIHPTSGRLLDARPIQPATLDVGFHAEPERTP
jgi:hypothetical protein